MAAGGFAAGGGGGGAIMGLEPPEITHYSDDGFKAFRSVTSGCFFKAFHTLWRSEDDDPLAEKTNKHFQKNPLDLISGLFSLPVADEGNVASVPGSPAGEWSSTETCFVLRLWFFQYNTGNSAGWASLE